MKANLFNFKFYTDGLKQLRPIGLITGLITLAACVLPILANYHPGVKYGVMQNVPSAAGTAPALLVFMFLGSLLLVYRAFAFLNFRKPSDYYHSLPQTRTCTYISLAASALTWIYGVIICSVFAVWLTHALTGVPVNMGFIPYVLFANLAGATLIAGCALMALCITGTIFSNIVVTGLILFLPRFILSAAGVVISYMTPIAELTELGIFLNPAMNLPAAFVFSLVGTVSVNMNVSMSAIIVNTGGIVYTAALGILYIAAGALLFKTRKSETAGKNAPGRAMQHVFRCALTLPILYLYLAVSMAYGNDNFIFSFSTLYVIVFSLAVYFIYELVTAGKFKSLLKAAPYYLAVVAAAIMLCFAVRMTANTVLYNTPAPEEIASVRFCVTNPDSSWHGYTELQFENIAFDDPEIKNIISAALIDTINARKPEDRYGVGHTGVYHTFSIACTNGAILSRNIMLSPDKARTLRKIQSANPQYEKILRLLPSSDEISMIEMGEMKPQEITKIWNTYRQEFSALSNEQIMQIAQVDSLEYTDPARDCFGAINVSGFSGSHEFHSNYGLSVLTPVSSDMFLQYFYTNGLKTYPVYMDHISNSDKYIGNSNSNAYYDYTIEFFNLPENVKKPIEFRSEYIGDANNLQREIDKQLFKIISENGLQKPELSKPLAKIHIFTVGTDMEHDYFGPIYIALSNEQVNKLTELYHKTYSPVDENF